MTLSPTKSNQNTPNSSCPVPNWKVFKRDSEAGRLLGRLYGVSSHEPKIHYPKFKKRSQSSQGGGKEDGSDDLSQRSPWNQTKRDKTKTKVIVKVPKVGQPKQLPKSSLVATIPRRKTEESCQKDLKRNVMLRSHYRPPIHHTSMASEKDRLCELHEYGGGCALPNELTNPKQELPSQAKKVEDKKEKGYEKDDETQNWNIADQIVTEIKERQEFQLEMEENGVGDATRDKMVMEISKRMEQLMKIDMEKARQLARS